jgi:hypothetical protein
MAQLHFGRHAGEPLSAVPTRYLRWLLAGCERLDDGLRQEVKQELRRRGERYLPANAVLADLEEMLTTRVREDWRLDHETAGLISDHLLESFEELRDRHGIGDASELVIAPPRHGPGGWRGTEE